MLKKVQCKLGCRSVPLGVFVQWTVGHKAVDGFSVVLIFLPNICALFVRIDATFLFFWFFVVFVLMELLSAQHHVVPDTPLSLVLYTVLFKQIIYDSYQNAEVCTDRMTVAAETSLEELEELLTGSTPEHQNV